MKITELNVGDLIVLGGKKAKCCPFHDLIVTKCDPKQVGTVEHIAEIVELKPATNEVMALVGKGQGHTIDLSLCTKLNIPTFKCYQHSWRWIHLDAIIRKEEGHW